MSLDDAFLLTLWMIGFLSILTVGGYIADEIERRLDK